MTTLTNRMKKILFFVIYCIVLLEIAARVFLWFALNRYADEHIAEPYKTRMKSFYNRAAAESSHLPNTEYKFDPICYAIPKDEMFFRGPDDLRVRKIAKGKSEDEVRVMCVGPSTTYGLFVDYENSWPRILERKLQARYPDKKIVVLNAGIPGASKKQLKRVFQIYLAQYSADIVLWKNGLNVNDSYEIPKRIIFPKYWLWRILYESRLFRSICVLIDLHLEKRGIVNRDYDTKDAVYDFLLQRGRTKSYEIEEGYTHGVDIIERIAKEHGTKHLVLVDSVAVERYPELCSDYTETTTQKYIHTTPAFREKLKSMSRRDIFVEWGHLTEIGTEIVAEEVFKFLTHDEELMKIFE
ncbi:SGNH/GDSL hydrolase family protein [Candidatus Omnitrophota bacterium]